MPWCTYPMNETLYANKSPFTSYTTYATLTFHSGARRDFTLMWHHMFNMAAEFNLVEMAGWEASSKNIPASPSQILMNLVCKCSHLGCEWWVWFVTAHIGRGCDVFGLWPLTLGGDVMSLVRKCSCLGKQWIQAANTHVQSKNNEFDLRHWVDQEMLTFWSVYIMVFVYEHSCLASKQ